MNLTVKNISISNFNFIDEYNIGIVIAQFPEQLGSPPYKIKDEYRDNNKELIQNTFKLVNRSLFSNSSKCNVLLIPELSLTCESAELIHTLIKEDTTLKNFLVYAGLEQLTKEEFLECLKNADNCDDFPAETLGENIKYVNSALLIIKDNDGIIKKYFIPKIYKSNYELIDQFDSKILYLFKISIYHIIFNICSDLIMADHKPALQKIIKSIHESMLPGESINLDIIFHVEKNPHPLTHYETIVRELRENQHSNRIKTTDTLICAVNAPKNSENKYGCSNLSVMKRGKQPEKLLNSSAVPTFYWKSFSKKRGEDEGTYHYIQWRLNEEGIVSFILDINSTDHLPHKSNWPIIEPAIYTLQDLIKKDINPELFVLKDILTTSFNRYLNSTFGRLKVKESLSNLPSYERLLEDIINKRPHKLNEALYILYDLKDKKINCDFWDKETDIYNSFILILKLLNIQFSSDLSLVEYLQVKNKVILIVDSTGKRDYELYENKFYEKIISNYNVDLIIFQRMILINWNGAPVPHDEINTSVAKIASVSSDPCSGVQLPDISKPQKPLLMTIEYIIKQLEEKELTPYEIERKINECFQFSNSW